MRKLLLFLQNVFVFLEVHNFTLVRMSLYGRMRSLTHTYVKLHADVRVKHAFRHGMKQVLSYFTGNSQKGIKIFKKESYHPENKHFAVYMNNKPIADSFIQCPLPPIRKSRKRINQAVCRKFRSPHIKNRNLLSRKRFKHAIFFNRYKQPIISQHPHFCLLHIVSKQTDVSQSMIFPLTGSPIIVISRLP